jgi:hypothetical protein
VDQSQKLSVKLNKAKQKLFVSIHLGIPNIFIKMTNLPTLNSHVEGVPGGMILFSAIA